MRYVAFSLILILLIFGALRVTAGNSTKAYHYSLFSQKQFFDEAYDLAPASPRVAETPKAILVNHHLLAKPLVAQAFNTLGNVPGRPTVVLLSPNHFDLGHGQITTTDYAWQTPYGVLEPDMDVIAQLTGSELVRVDPRPFNKEHGVSGIVPFIKKSLPDATVVPITFKSTLTLAAVEKFAEELAARLPANSIIVTSVDMSHYVGEDVALPQDDMTISGLLSGIPHALWSAKADSPAALVTTMSLMQKKTLKFHLLQRSSSEILTGSTDPTQNTSYITGYWN